MIGIIIEVIFMKVILAGFMIIIKFLLIIINLVFNTDFRRKYLELKYVFEDFKSTGDENNLKQKLNNYNPYPKKTSNILFKLLNILNDIFKIQYSPYYDNNIKIDNDEYFMSNYDDQKLFYFKAIDIANKYYLDSNLIRGLKNKGKTDKKFEFLTSEIKSDLGVDKDKMQIKILESKKRYLDYLLENKIEIEKQEYFTELLNKISQKLK